jgi:hypothetical protein
MVGRPDRRARDRVVAGARLTGPARSWRNGLMGGRHSARSGLCDDRRPQLLYLRTGIGDGSTHLGSAGKEWLYAPGLLGKVRIRVTPASSGPALFVGIGRTADVDRYLAGVSHTVISDFFGNRTRSVDGGPAGSAPETQQLLGRLLDRSWGADPRLGSLEGIVGGRRDECQRATGDRHWGRPGSSLPVTGVDRRRFPGRGSGLAGRRGAPDRGRDPRPRFRPSENGVKREGRNHAER